MRIVVASNSIDSGWDLALSDGDSRFGKRQVLEMTDPNRHRTFNPRSPSQSWRRSTRNGAGASCAPTRAADEEPQCINENKTYEECKKTETHSQRVPLAVLPFNAGARRLLSLRDEDQSHRDRISALPLPEKKMLLIEFLGTGVHLKAHPRTRRG